MGKLERLEKSGELGESIKEEKKEKRETEVVTLVRMKEIRNLFEELVSRKVVFTYVKYFSNIMAIELERSSLEFKMAPGSDEHCQFVVCLKNTSGFYIDDIDKIEVDIVEDLLLESYYIYFKNGEKLCLVAE